MILILILICFGREETNDYQLRHVVWMSVHPYENNYLRTGKHFVTLSIDNSCEEVHVCLISHKITDTLHEDGPTFTKYFAVFFWDWEIQVFRIKLAVKMKNVCYEIIYQNRCVYEITTGNTTEHETSINWLCTFILILVWRTNPTTQFSYRHVMFMCS
jgi:hypothetical protein